MDRLRRKQPQATARQVNELPVVSGDREKGGFAIGPGCVSPSGMGTDACEYLCVSPYFSLATATRWSIISLHFSMFADLSWGSPVALK